MDLFGRLTGWSDQVKTGHYYIEPGMSNWAVLDKVRKGLQDPIRITIPPGTRPERLGRILRNQLGTDSTEVARLLRDPAFADSLDTDVAHLHGQMLAETFDMYWTDDAETALRRIHERYERFWSDDRRAQADALGLTPDEVVTMASIVEWEARKPEERRTIAGLYLNRSAGPHVVRHNAPPGRPDRPVRADGGGRRAPDAPPVLPRLRLPERVQHLPHRRPAARPHHQPRDGTIDAVLNNEANDFLYFVADGTGGHDFSTTLAEHNAKAARWSQYMQEQTRIRRQREAAGE